MSAQQSAWHIADASCWHVADSALPPLLLRELPTFVGRAQVCFSGRLDLRAGWLGSPVRGREAPSGWVRLSWLRHSSGLSSSRSSLPDPPRTGWAPPGLASRGEKETAQPSLSTTRQPVLGGSWSLGRKRGTRPSKARGSLASTEPLPAPVTLELRAWLPGVGEPRGLAASPGWALTCVCPCRLPDQHILRDLEKKKILVFTPSRRVGGKRVVCYDDRFIVKLAFESDGIVVSNDTYRDLQGERQEWKRFIEERLLMYSFVNDKYVPATAAAGGAQGRDRAGAALWLSRVALGLGSSEREMDRTPQTGLGEGGAFWFRGWVRSLWDRRWSVLQDGLSSSQPQTSGLSELPAGESPRTVTLWTGTSSLTRDSPPESGGILLGGH